MSTSKLNHRPVVLTFLGTYLPGYRDGGPSRTLANMVEQLGDRLEFRIVTQDRDAGDLSPYPGIVPEKWMPLGKGYVFYVPRKRLSLGLVSAIIRSQAHDILYLNSFFDRIFTARVLAASRLGLYRRAPTLLAPRGEFSAGALRYKRLRKQAYIRVFRTLRCGPDVIWQASTPLEKSDIHTAIPDVPLERIMVARDLTSSAAVKADRLPAPVDGPLRVLFLSRISPMKNLAFALRVLALVRHPIALSIVGPREEAYWQSCQPAVEALAKNIAVDIRGAIPPHEVADVMRQHDLLFLPTQGENFGHVIHEALREGLPVLISDRTPWNVINEAGAGWALPLDAPEAFVNVIDQYATAPAASRLTVRQAAMRLGAEHALDSSAVEDNVCLFTHALKQSTCTTS